MQHPLIGCGRLHYDLRDLSNLWEAMFHHFYSALRLTHSIPKELHLNVLKAVLPLAVPSLNVLYDSLMEVPDQLPGEAPHVVEHLETQQVPHFAFVHRQLQLQDVKVAQHEEIQRQVVVLHRHAIQTGQELLWGVQGLLPVEPVDNTGWLIEMHVPGCN